MSRFKKQNLRNIQCIFEEKTGTDLNPAHHSSAPSKKRLVLAAVTMVCCLALVSCACILFSPLNGDALSLRGSYERGVVSVFVVNGAERTLEFQEQVKLMDLLTGEELQPGGGTVRFENTRFPPHSSGVMTIHLSDAYPMEQIEAAAQAPNTLYLRLTNKDFQPGHDWVCHFLLWEPEATPETAQEEPTETTSLPQTGGDVDETLQFYFQKTYLDVAPAFNEANGAYMAAVQALLAQQAGGQVHSMDPLLVADDPEPGVVFDPHIPEEEQYRLVMQGHHYLDSLGRMVSSVFPAGGLGTALALGVSLPQEAGQTDGGIGDFRLLYFFTFPTPEITREGAYAFVAGHILAFPEMEDNMVYQDEQYTIYDLTDLFYTDLDGYIDQFLGDYGGKVFCDESVRQRIHRIYDYYRDRENLNFHYVLPPE